MSRPDHVAVPLTAEDRVLAVLDLVDQIPPGRVMSYGDIAGYLGITSARQVGRVMALHGGEVPWHRVVMADGRPAPHHVSEQLARLRVDGVPISAGRVDMRSARWWPGRQSDP